MKRPKKTIEEEDRALFRDAMRDVRPLGRAPRETAPIRSRPPAPRPRPERPDPPRLEHAAADRRGLQARTRQRLRRGQIRPEATLDLHGLTRDEALACLEAFLGRAHTEGRRCVLVIHGIGRSRLAGGVLRNALPGWLEAHPEVLDSAPARPADGGAGASYVLLRSAPPR